MDARAWLEWQVEWGADEALLASPRDRLRAAIPEVPHAPDGRQSPGPVRAEAATEAPGALAPDAGLVERAADLDTLRGMMERFDACPLQATAYRLVFGGGYESAAVMVIGDTPGDAEDRSGEPFQGPAGLLLRQMLGSVGLSDANCRFAYAIPWRPPGNRRPSDHERRLCLPFLYRHIALVRPRWLLLLGQAATATILQAESAAARRMRGVWQSADLPGLPAPIACMPSCNPDHLLKVPADRRQAWADLLELRVKLEPVAG